MRILFSWEYFSLVALSSIWTYCSWTSIVKFSITSDTMSIISCDVSLESSIRVILRGILLSWSNTFNCTSFIFAFPRYLIEIRVLKVIIYILSTDSTCHSISTLISWLSYLTSFLLNLFLEVCLYFLGWLRPLSSSFRTYYLLSIERIFILFYHRVVLIKVSWVKG